MFDERRWAAAPDEIDQVLRLSGVQPPADVLDVCCGPGRHALELARRGFHVVGIDQTAVYLDEARRRAELERLHVSFLEADARELVVPVSFDLAINLYTSFGYFASADEDLAMLRNVACSLRTGGALVLQVQAKELAVARIAGRRWEEVPGGYFLEESELTDELSFIRTRWIVIREGQAREATFRVRLYSSVELRHLLAAAGFGEVRLFGGLDGAAYDASAKRLVAVARK